MGMITFTLRRLYAAKYGIFSSLLDETNKPIFGTLEHAYEQPDISFKPKIPNGTYTCVRGSHRLHSMTQDFITFEVTNIAGHDNILFHAGNFNNDSEGCILLGDIIVSSQPTQVYNSKASFAKFMEEMKDVDQFTLNVEG